MTAFPRLPVLPPRLHTTLRVIGAVAGAWWFAAGAAALVMALMAAASQPGGSSEQLGMIVAILLLLSAFLWGCAQARVWRMWGVLFSGGALLGGAAWLLQVQLLGHGA